MNIKDIVSKVGDVAVNATVHAQVVLSARKQTGNGSPFYEVRLSDGTGELKLRIWNNSPAFPFFNSHERAEKGEFVSVVGEFTRSDFGVEARVSAVQCLSEADIRALLDGGEERRAFLEERWRVIEELLATIEDRALAGICGLFVQKYGEAFRRAAAARGNHHARRGGLVEHVSLMMKSAAALCTVYPELHRDLVLAGAFLHDLGKMWENQYEASGFSMPFTFRAECFGHIAMGVEVVRRLAGEMPKYVADWNEEDSLQVDALCHLILSHHGQLEWGSPVTPKMPEAHVLHFVDNIDAKLEMCREGYITQALVGELVHDRCRPLGVNLLVTPRRK